MDRRRSLRGHRAPLSAGSIDCDRHEVTAIRRRLSLAGCESKGPISIHYFKALSEHLTAEHGAQLRQTGVPRYAGSGRIGSIICGNSLRWMISAFQTRSETTPARSDPSSTISRRSPRSGAGSRGASLRSWQVTPIELGYPYAGSGQVCAPNLRVESSFVRRPRAQWFTDFPVVTEWVDDPSQPPTMRFNHWRRWDCTGALRTVQYRFRIVDHQQRPARRAADRLRAEAVHACICGYYPEPGAPHIELRHDVVALAHAVEDGCLECRPVEGHRSACSIHP